MHVCWANSYCEFKIVHELEPTFNEFYCNLRDIIDLGLELIIQRSFYAPQITMKSTKYSCKAASYLS